MPTVLAGPASPGLADGLAKALGADRVTPDVKRFPDGEAHVRIATPITGHAVVVQSVTTDAALVELLLLQDAAREAGATAVTTVVPYLGYARQDRAFAPGEAVSSRAVARAIGSGCDAVITVDPHKETVLDFFPKASMVSAVDLLADALAGWDVDMVLAPDKGARERAERAAKHIGVPFDHLEKTRHSATEVSMRPKALDVRGKRVAILDDLIASGGTMVTAARQLREQGAIAVGAACTHGVFSDGAEARLLASGIDRLWCTDTIEGASCTVVGAAAAVARALQTTAMH